MTENQKDRLQYELEKLLAKMSARGVKINWNVNETEMKIILSASFKRTKE